MIAVVAATHLELPHWCRDSLAKAPDFFVRDGILWGVTGVGSAKVRRFYRKLDDAGVVLSVMVVGGFAGAVGEDFAVGDVVLLREVVNKGNCQYSLLTLPGFRQVRGLEVSKWTDGDEKNGLGMEADVIDMETFTHAEECAKRGRRLLSLRVISDAYGERLPSVPYIFDSWEHVMWKRFWEHPLLFLRGFFFSWRLWRCALILEKYLLMVCDQLLSEEREERR